MSLTPVTAPRTPLDQGAPSYSEVAPDSRTFATLLQTAAATDSALVSVAARQDGVVTLGEMLGTSGFPTSGGLGGLATLGSYGLGTDGQTGLSAAGLGASGLGAGSGVGGRTGALLDAALSQVGTPYIFGAEAAATDLDPESFDCSELTQWAAAQAGVDLPDGSWIQYLQAKGSGNAISVDDALRTPGALLFSFDQEPTADGGRPGGAHVAISLGDGRTVEARGRAYGVTVAQAGNRFTHAALVPGLSG